MDSVIFDKISKYAKVFAQKRFIESGYIAMRDGDGIFITATKADLNNLGENDVVFVNDKNIESLEGNFRAAAVILFCAIRQDGGATAAAIVDSDAILQFSSKRKPLLPVIDSVAHLLGSTVKCASKNVAAEIVTALSGYRNACLMPDAGAVVKARSFDELINAVAVLDKACRADILAEDNGGTQHLNAVTALFEQVIYKLKTSKTSAAKDAQSNTAAQNGKTALHGENNTNQSSEAAASENNNEQTENTQNGEDVVNANNGQTENAQNSKPAMVQESEDIVRMTTVDGKILALCCPQYVATVAAIGKPMAVTDEFKDTFGEEIACLPSKTVLSDKALAKLAQLMNGAEVCFMAQHGVLILANDKEALTGKLEKIENACKAYFKA